MMLPPPATSVRRAALVATVALIAAVVRPLAAHDVSETSATVIVRDGGHVALRLQVPWAEVLRARWMPGASMEEFLSRASNQDAAAFARELARVEGSVERATHLVADADAPKAFVRWQWPSPVEVQDALRRELMSRIADGAPFAHASRLTTSTELTLGREPATVRLQLPDVLGPVLLTVYRPTEQWLGPGQISAPTSVSRRR